MPNGIFVLPLVVRSGSVLFSAFRFLQRQLFWLPVVHRIMLAPILTCS
jgi:hypothetical protein